MSLRVPVSSADHSQGKGPVTLVEYGDYECPYCGQAYPLVKAVQQRLGDRLTFVFRNFPLTEAHPHAFHAAEVAEAAGKQGKFWEMHDLLYEHQNRLGDVQLRGYAEKLGLDLDRLQADLEAATAKIEADFNGGVRSGVNGTPSFFIDGKRFDGDWTDVDAFVAALGG